MALSLLLAAPGVHAGERSGDTLAALTVCFAGTEFRATSTERLPAGVTARTVETASGPLSVSLADGYRQVIHRHGTAPLVNPLVNLKLERSAAGQFGADRAAILQQMTYMAQMANMAADRQLVPAVRASASDADDDVVRTRLLDLLHDCMVRARPAPAAQDRDRTR